MVSAGHFKQRLFLFSCVACICLFTDALDCRRFVFAPLCRGVSAKRSTKLTRDDLSRELGELDDSWMDWPKPSPEDSFHKSSQGSNKLLQELLEKFRDYATLRADEQ